MEVDRLEVREWLEMERMLAERMEVEMTVVE